VIGLFNTIIGSEKYHTIGLLHELAVIPITIGSFYKPVVMGGFQTRNVKHYVKTSNK
jgi:hypothetical protein